MMNKRKAIIENDMILIHIENAPAFFARVEKISSDVKPGWWRIKLLLLSLPVKIVTWILDDEQIRGAEFTMSSTPVRLEKIDLPVDSEDEETTKNKPKAEATKSARILSLNNKKV